MNQRDTFLKEEMERKILIVALTSPWKQINEITFGLLHIYIYIYIYIYMSVCLCVCVCVYMCVCVCVCVCVVKRNGKKNTYKRMRKF